jgi:hypothetical protein
MDLTNCPEPDCDAPAEVLENYLLLDDRHRGVIHVVTYCINGHKLTAAI